MSEHHQDSSAAVAATQPHVQDLQQQPPQHQHQHQFVATTGAGTPPATATTQQTAPSPTSVAATAAAATAAVNQSQGAVAVASRPGEELSCLWQGCTEKCPTAETLYVGSSILPDV